jgi:hypothetical protein
MQIASSGDKTALRALLTVPSYLAPIPPDQLAIIRDEVAKKAYPDRFAKLEAFRAMIAATERAVDGVARFVEQEAMRPVEVEAARAQSMQVRQRAPQPA